MWIKYIEIFGVAKVLSIFFFFFLVLSKKSLGGGDATLIQGPGQVRLTDHPPKGNC